ncbi:MAG: hypothetical protein B5M49_03005 [Thermotoga sp. 4484_232]|nr:hypothetical protein [Thermotogaceae bacterium]OQX57808.1 MAG: hypothetical protein B5M49_03005 [Thermotoga sp. 4484_232]RKX40528.1 MAG: hypothetical protein DRP23_02865 [Thermotogota bacterium]RKX56188.1 MAG: hypothetical protein DRP24_03660 [Thermotoga sp.]HDG61603.1 hypothetical protein [Thermotoga sp.]
MEIFMIVVVVGVIYLIFEKKVWGKLLALSSLSLKVSLLIALVSFSKSLDYLNDVALMYFLVSGSGIVLLAYFLSGRREE